MKLWKVLLLGTILLMLLGIASGCISALAKQHPILTPETTATPSPTPCPTMMVDCSGYPDGWTDFYLIVEKWPYGPPVWLLEGYQYLDGHHSSWLVNSRLWYGIQEGWVVAFFKYSWDDVYWKWRCMDGIEYSTNCVSPMSQHLPLVVKLWSAQRLLQLGPEE